MPGLVADLKQAEEVRAFEASQQAEAQRWAALPRDAYRGQVRMCRGDRLGRLADAIAADRGRAFAVPDS